jgi:hypothetical protein
MSRPRVEGIITIENARVFFKNFQGLESQFNRKGNHCFCVELDPEKIDIQDLIDDGWNVKHTKIREEGDTPKPYLQVNVSFKGRPARVVMIGSTTKKRTELDEDTIGLLDFADFKTADLIINPYNWDIRGEQGVSAYVKTMYVTIEEDYLELKYAEEEPPWEES